MNDQQERSIHDESVNALRESTWVRRHRERAIDRGSLHIAAASPTLGDGILADVRISVDGGGTRALTRPRPTDMAKRNAPTVAIWPEYAPRPETRFCAVCRSVVGRLHWSTQSHRDATRVRVIPTAKSAGRRPWSVGARGDDQGTARQNAAAARRLAAMS